MKPIKTIIKLQLPAGAATPAPPLGPTLGQHGVNIQQFVTSFNEKTQEFRPDVLPLKLTIYEDRTFDFVVGAPVVSSLIKKAAKIKKGSSVPNMNKVARITDAQVQEIAEVKMKDLNARNVDSAKKIVTGTARSMGVEVK